MSLTEDARSTEREVPGRVPAALRCESCRAPLAPDQEWCFQCGAARTVIHRPGNWRVPVALVALVVALVLAGLAIALVNLSNEANRAAATTTVTAPSR